MFVLEMAGRLGLSLPAVFFGLFGQGYVPVLVVGNAEAGNGGGPVFQLGGFLVEGQNATDRVR